MPVHIPIPINRTKDVGVDVVDGKKVLEMVKEADVNKDGKLSKEELKKLVQKMKSWWPDFRAWLIMLKIDRDHDGEIGPDEINDLVDYLVKWYNNA